MAWHARQRPTAVTTAFVLFVVVTGVAFLDLGTDHTAHADRATTLVRLKPGDASSSAAHYIQTGISGKYGDAYTTAAMANLTEFQERALSIGIPFFGVSQASGGKNNSNIWKQLEPVVSCPPDQPLQRYGGGGDGSKLLCKLPQPEGAGGGCVIYSLGSNGKPGDML
jgi:hypothetical protein